MATRGSTRSFLRAAILVAALGGVIVGLLSGVSETVRQWQAGWFSAGQLAYAAAAAGALLVIAACLLGRARGTGLPFVSLIVGFAIVALACGGIARDLNGRYGEFFLWVSGCSLGAAAGLFLAHRMMRRAEH
jgi:hypothetical protein